MYEAVKPATEQHSRDNKSPKERENVKCKTNLDIFHTAIVYLRSELIDKILVFMSFSFLH